MCVHHSYRLGKPVACLMLSSCRRQIHFGRLSLEKKKKKAFDFKTIKQLNAWKKDTDQIFGPPVKPSASKSRKTSKMVVHDTFDDSHLKGLSAISSETLKSGRSDDFSGKAAKSSKSAGLGKAVKKPKGMIQPAEKGNESLKIPTITAIPPSASFDVNCKTSNITEQLSCSEGHSRDDDNSVTKNSSFMDKRFSVNSDQSSLPGTSCNSDVSSSFTFNAIKLFPFMPTEAQERMELMKFKSEVEKLALRVTPSVKSVLNKTMPDLNRFFLNRWREKMIKELSEEGFKQLQFENIRKGTNFHANVLEFLGGKPYKDLQIMPENEGHWSSLEQVLAELDGVKALEVEVSHPELLYKGVFDCVAVYKDVLCLIDWKTSKQPRPLLKNTYDDPLQVSAYLGAVNASEQCKGKFGQIHHGLIVVAYPDGSPAHVHWMDHGLCLQYWAEWTQRLTTYFQMVYSEKLKPQS